VLILIQPHIEVKHVVHTTASKLDVWNIEFCQEGESDPEIPGGFIF
jgi:hypothetical protein